MDNWSSGFAEADIDDEFDEDFGYEQEYDEGEDGEAEPATASTSTKDFGAPKGSSSVTASVQPAELAHASSAATSTDTSNTATAQMSSYAADILNKPMTANTTLLEEAPALPSLSSSSIDEPYQSTLSESLNGGGRWRSGNGTTPAASAAQGQRHTNKRARRTAVAAATISGGSGGIGGVAGKMNGAGGGGLVPGVGFALATRMALHTDRLDAKDYGAFDRPPLEETVMCTLANGNRLYVPLASSDSASSSSSSSSASAVAPTSSLLAVPMAELRSEVNQLRLAQAAVQQTNAASNDNDDGDDSSHRSEKPAVAMKAATAAASLPASALVLMTGAEVETTKLQGVHAGVDNDDDDDDGNDKEDQANDTGMQSSSAQNDGEAVDSDSDEDIGKVGMEDDEDDEEGKEDDEDADEKSGSKLKVAPNTKKAAAPRAANGRNEAGSRELWVQKYAPKHFSELLSAEALNRGVLHALKAWDAHVFKTPLEEARSHESAASAGLFGAAKAVADKALRDDNSSSSKQANQNAMDGDDNDEASEGSRRKVDQRPRVRIVLLCGPPGTGKTTLAHVAARHAGYAPREINASDDRSAEALREGVTRAMESQSMFGDKKPNCVILDEIDGADAKGAIQAVVDMAKAPLRPKHHKKGGATPLTRPLVCICNDPFAPHLRPLREVALTFHFKGTPEARLLSRLKFICKAEAQNSAAQAAAQASITSAKGGKGPAKIKSITTSMSGTLGDMNASALSALCAATGNDMRSSINILQFVSMRKATLAHDDMQFKAPLPSGTSSSSAPADSSSIPPDVLPPPPPPPPSSSFLLLRTLEAGIKDERHDLLEVLTTVFWRKKATATSSSSGGGGGNNSVQAAQRLRGAAISEAANNASTAPSSSSSSGAQAGTTATTINKSKNTNTSAVSATMASAANHGEHASIALGIYENFGSISFRDPWMVKTAELLDWLAWQSTLQRRVDEDQQYALLGLMPAAAAAAHCLCSSDLRPPKLQRPQEWRKRKQISDQRQSILQSFVDGAQLQPSQDHRSASSKTADKSDAASTAEEKGSGRTCVDRSTAVAVLDVIPHLLTVLSPEIRGSMNPDLFTPQEKAAMAQSIDVLGAYGLSYGPSFVDSATARHSGLGSGEVPYQLLPEIDLLVSFEAQNSNNDGSAPGYHKPNNKGSGAAAAASEWATGVASALAHNVRRAPGVASLVPNSVRVATAREVAINKLRRQEAARQNSEDLSSAFASSSTSSSSSSSSAAAATNKAAAAAAATAIAPTSKATPAAVAAAAAESTRKRDFFGNLMPEPSAANSGGGGSSTDGARKVPKHEAEAAAAAAAAAVPIKYQFKKGFTNAIKRPVYMADFL